MSELSVVIFGIFISELQNVHVYTCTVINHHLATWGCGTIAVRTRALLKSSPKYT